MAVSVGKTAGGAVQHQKLNTVNQTTSELLRTLLEQSFQLLPLASGMPAPVAEAAGQTAAQAPLPPSLGVSLLSPNVQLPPAPQFYAPEPVVPPPLPPMPPVPAPQFPTPPNAPVLAPPDRPDHLVQALTALSALAMGGQAQNLPALPFIAERLAAEDRHQQALQQYELDLANWQRHMQVAMLQHEHDKEVHKQTVQQMLLEYQTTVDAVNQGNAREFEIAKLNFEQQAELWKQQVDLVLRQAEADQQRRDAMVQRLFTDVAFQAMLRSAGPRNASELLASFGVIIDPRLLQRITDNPAVLAMELENQLKIETMRGQVLRNELSALDLAFAKKTLDVRVAQQRANVARTQAETTRALAQAEYYRAQARQLLNAGAVAAGIISAEDAVKLALAQVRQSKSALVELQKQFFGSKDMVSQLTDKLRTVPDYDKHRQVLLSAPQRVLDLYAQSLILGVANQSAMSSMAEINRLTTEFDNSIKWVRQQMANSPNQLVAGQLDNVNTYATRAAALLPAAITNRLTSLSPVPPNAPVEPVQPTETTAPPEGRPAAPPTGSAQPQTAPPASTAARPAQPQAAPPPSKPAAPAQPQAAPPPSKPAAPAQPPPARQPAATQPTRTQAKPEAKPQPMLQTDIGEILKHAPPLAIGDVKPLAGKVGENVSLRKQAEQPKPKAQMDVRKALDTKQKAGNVAEGSSAFSGLKQTERRQR